MPNDPIPERRSSDGISQQQFYNGMREIRDLVEARVAAVIEQVDRTGEKLEKKLDSQAVKMDDHAHEYLKVERRVAIIEEQRRNEAENAKRQEAWNRLYAAGGISGAIALIVQIVSKLWK